MFSVRHQGCSVKAPQTHSMVTRDGVRLDADVYWPEGWPEGWPEDRSEGAGPFPVLLMRQPYGRAIASSIVYAHPRWYAAHGYIVVIQDVRGRGSSAGKFELFRNEAADGADAVRWASQLPGCDGQVGMYGFSYQGMTQLYAAQALAAESVGHKPMGQLGSALKTIAPAMTGYHPYTDWAYENGALCLQLGLTWAIQLAAESARIAGELTTYQSLLAAATQLPTQLPGWDALPCPKVLEGVDSFFHDWVANPVPSEYWRQLTPDLSGVDMPMLHIGGWFDPYLRGDIRLYQEMTGQLAGGRSHPDSALMARHPLCIGPWGHIPWARKVGQMDFGPLAQSPIDALQIQWFNHVLKGEPFEQAQRPVCLFEMGRNRWRGFECWPPQASQAQSSQVSGGMAEDAVKTYFLHSQGLTHLREDSGLLADLPSANPTADYVVHDPWNPAPSLGGHCSIPAGVFERSAVDSRGDVLTYTSAPVESLLCVAGVVEVVGAIASSAPSYDLCAVLSRVCGRVREGKVFNITQGYRRVEVSAADQDTAIMTTVTLQPTCFSLLPGESLRLSISAACFPAYPINPGTGAQPQAVGRMGAQIITLAIAIGTNDGTQVTLPLVASEDLM
jgi:uncharacterized protein